MSRFSQFSFTSFLVVFALLAISACDGSSRNYSSRTSSYVSPDSFINALNRIDSQHANSYIVRDTWDSERTHQPGQEEWFVIYDAKHQEYKSVSLQYIRSIVYYDYYSNSSSLAREFRNIEDQDLSSGYWDGDPWGDDYEVVDYDFYSDLYFGRNSGYAYEDEEDSFDVSLMQSEQQERAFIEKAAAISYQFSLSVEASMSLISLGEKVKGMMHQSQGVTAQDQQALMSDLEHMTGLSVYDLADVVGGDDSAKEDVIQRVAEEIGTTASSLEHQILPELFGLNL